MDVQLLLAFILSVFIFPTLIIMLFFKPNFKANPTVRFFKNNRYQKLAYLMYIALALCILNLILINSGNTDFLPHVLVIAIFLLVFRKGIAK